MRNDTQIRIERWLRRSQLNAGIVQPRGESFALGTQLGSVRTENQDRVAIAKFLDRGGRTPEPIKLGVLCDGIGGMMDGGRCAELAMSAFITHAVTSTAALSVQLLSSAAHKANEAVYREFRGRGGATLVGVVAHGSSLIGVSAGDSRAYLMKREQGVVQLSTDDTLAGQLEALGEARVEARNELLQFIGMGADLLPHEFQSRISDDTRGVLLTSDGAHSIPDSVLSTILQNAARPREIVERLLSLSLWMGGRDNATALVMKIGDSEGKTSSFGVADTLELFAPSGSLEMVLNAYTEDNKSSPKESSAPAPRNDNRNHNKNFNNKNFNHRESDRTKRPRGKGRSKLEQQTFTASSRAKHADATEDYKPVVIIRPDNSEAQTGVVESEAQQPKPRDSEQTQHSKPADSAQTTERQRPGQDQAIESPSDDVNAHKEGEGNDTSQ